MAGRASAVLGIDGGGSKTAFYLEDENGRAIGRSTSGPSNWLSIGKDESYRNIADGITQLKIVPETAPGMVCGGFAGAGRPEGMAFYADCLRSLLPRARIMVETDAFIAYTGAIGLQPGMLLIAGTGSIAIGRREDGSMTRVGGWGPTFSDEGSGFWIGRRAIQIALRASDSGSDAEFIAALCRNLQVDSIHDVVGMWKSGVLTVPAIAALAALLFEQFPAPPADRILQEAAEQLATLAQAAIAQIALPQCRQSIAGSIGSHPLMQQLLQQHYGLAFQAPEHSPEQGAVIWARTQAQH